MASKQQVAAKAAKLGGKLIIMQDSAELVSPEGMHWEGYHSQVDYFYNDSKQAVWNAFWLAMKNQEACDCGQTNSDKQSEWEKQLAEIARIAAKQNQAAISFPSHLHKFS